MPLVQRWTGMVLVWTSEAPTIKARADAIGAARVAAVPRDHAVYTRTAWDDELVRAVVEESKRAREAFIE